MILPLPASWNPLLSLEGVKTWPEAVQAGTQVSPRLAGRMTAGSWTVTEVMGDVGCAGIGTGKVNRTVPIHKEEIDFIKNNG